MSQIERLEQDLVTDKQKFDDSPVDKMIQSTLRNPNREPRPGVHRPPIVTVKKKRIMEAPPQPAPARAPAPAQPKQVAMSVERPIVPPRPQEPRPAPAATKPAFRIDVSRISSPKEKDLELEFDEPEEKKPAPAPVVKPVAERQVNVKQPAPAARQTTPAAAKPGTSAQVTKPAMPSSAPAAKPVASAPISKPAAPSPVPASAPSPAPAQSKQPEKAVRRVVTPAAQPKPQIATPEKPKQQMPMASQLKPAAEKPKVPTAPPRRQAEPEKEEKKSRFGGFGKMFSISQPHDKKDERPAGHSAPEKIRGDGPKAPPKQTVKVFICPLCNAEVKETEKTCPNCGAEFE